MRALRVDVSWRTLLKVLAALVAVWLWLRLWQWVLLFVVAIFIAIGLDPLVARLEARRLPRRYGAPLVVLALTGLLVAFGSFAGAQLVEQGRMVSGRIEEFTQEVTRKIPKGLMDLLPKGPSGGGAQESGGGSSGVGGYVARLGTALLNALLSIGIALILTVYLLLDGRRTFDWLVAFAPPRHRPRIRETAIEGRKSIAAYVRGNLTTSALAAVITYLFLVVLNVPAALLLALLAGLLDFVPVLGVVLSAIPAVLLAMTVSPAVGVAVAAFYLLYNLVENYYIAPKVYGRALRLSDLAVILAFAIGAELGGVIGALIALPLAAMYPAVENIWLADRLGERTARDHRRIEEQEQR